MAKEAKTNAMRFLEKEGVEYESSIFEGEFTDGLTQALAKGQEPAKTFKTLVTKGRGGAHFVFVIPVARELDLKAAARAVGEKNVEMIHVKDINAVTGYVRGGCSPIGMKKQFATVLDSSALSFERIYVSGGRIGLSLLLPTRELIRVTGAKTADICKAEEEGR